MPEIDTTYRVVRDAAPPSHHELTFKKKLWNVTFSPDESHYATVTKDGGPIHIWRTGVGASEKPLQVGPARMLSRPCFHPTVPGRILAVDYSGLSEHDYALGASQAKAPTRTFSGCLNGTTCNYSHDGRQIAGGEGKGVVLWDARSPQTTAYLPLTQDRQEYYFEAEAVFSADDRKLCVSGQNFTDTQLYDLRYTQLPYYQTSGYGNIDGTADRMLVSRRYGTDLKLYDTQRDVVLNDLTAITPMSLLDHHRAYFTRASHRFVTYRDYEGVRAWDTRAETWRSLGMGENRGPSFSRDESQFLSISRHDVHRHALVF